MALSPAQVAHGPMLIGTLLNVLLYGITITQLYLYICSPISKRDQLFIRIFVCLLFIGDTIQTIFTITSIYNALINHFGNLEYLKTGNWVFATDPALTGILGGLVQSFFAWRIKVLTGNYIIVFVILVCAASSFLMGIATAIAIGIVPQFVEFQRFKVVVVIWLVSASFADIIITTVLVTYLRNHRTGFANTDSNIDRIIRLTVQTGLLTAVWALVDLLVYLLDPSGKHLIFNFPLSKLYTNSLMSSLNSRNGWKYDDSDSQSLSMSNADRRDAENSEHRPALRINTEGTPVFVRAESYEMVASSGLTRSTTGKSDLWDVRMEAKK